MTDKVGTTLRAYCSQCGGDRNCEIKGHHTERGGADHYQWYVDWYLLACRGCDHVFAQTVSSNSEDYHNEYDENGETITVHEETIEAWPSRTKRPIPTWFEHSVIESDLKDTGALNASLKELYSALDAELLVLASIGIRTTLDIASELLGIKSGLRFEEKVKSLVVNGHIDEADQGHIEILIDAGSASAHRGWQPKAADIDALMTSLEDFLFQSIVLPSRKRTQAAKLAAVGAKVPKREPKPRQAD